MKYLKDEVKLLQKIKNNINLSDEEKLALTLILEQYNKIFPMALHQQKYIEDKREQYAQNMENNFKLNDRNKYLEDSNKRYKVLYKEQLKYIKNLEKQLRMMKKLLDVQNNTNSNK